MEEKISKRISKNYYFENSKEKLEVSILIDNVDPYKLEKRKDFLEIMFKEILKEIIY